MGRRLGLEKRVRHSRQGRMKRQHRSKTGNFV
jgi:hypothetical protein